MLNRPSVDDADNIDGDGYDHVLTNNLSYQKAFGYKLFSNIDTSRNTLATNSWQLGLSLSDSEFESLDIELLTSPRKENGSLPDIDFMRPTQGSNLIDAGTDIGFEFIGDAPELGAIEVNYPTDIRNIEESIPEKISLLQNYPNPFNPETIIRYSLPSAGYVSLKVYDICGRLISSLVDEYQQAGNHNVVFNMQLTTNHQQLVSGVYFYQLRTKEYSYTKKMLLIK